MQTISDLTQNIQGEFVWGTPLLLFVAPFRDLGVGREDKRCCEIGIILALSEQNNVSFIILPNMVL